MARFLLVSHAIPPVVGGSAIVYDQVAKALHPDVVVATTRFILGQTGRRDDHSDAPYEIVSLPMLRPPERDHLKLIAPFDRLLVDLPLLLLIYVRFCALLVRRRVKTVILGDLISLGWLAIVLRLMPFRPRIVIYLHGEELTLDNVSIYARLRRKALHSADRVVAITRFCRDRAMALYDLPADRIDVTLNGVDFAGFGDVRAARAGRRFPNAPAYRLLSVGRLIPRKGFINLVRAMPLVRARFPAASLDIVGDGPLLENLRTLIADLGLEEAVRLRGFLPAEAVRDLYAGADVFVQPGITLDDGDCEGFGLVFLDANACGLPVVGGRSGGVGEAIRDGETGYLVDGDSLEAIADAVAKLLGSPENHAAMSAAGLRWAASNDWAARRRDIRTIFAGI